MRHPVSYLFYISSLGRRVLATAPTLGGSLDIGVRWRLILKRSSPAQQRCWLDWRYVYILPTIQQTAAEGHRCSKYSFQIVTADVVGFSLGMFESMWFIAWWAVKCCWIVEWCTHFSISYDNIEYFIFRSLMFKTNNNIRSAKCAARRRWKFTKWVCTHMCHPRTSLATPTLDSAPSQMINIGDRMFLVVAVA